jgi:hypothetical protein
LPIYKEIQRKRKYIIPRLILYQLEKVHGLAEEESGRGNMYF